MSTRHVRSLERIPREMNKLSDRILGKYGGSFLPEFGAGYTNLIEDQSLYTGLI